MTGQDEREVPNMEYLTAWARREFGVSNGTQTWVEFQGSAEMLAKAVLDILPPQITPTAEVKAEALDEFVAKVTGELAATRDEGIDLGEHYLYGMRSALMQATEYATHLRENGGA